MARHGSGHAGRRVAILGRNARPIIALAPSTTGRCLEPSGNR
jgi:hypothetical protein